MFTQELCSFRIFYWSLADSRALTGRCPFKSSTCLELTDVAAAESTLIRPEDITVGMELVGYLLQQQVKARNGVFRKHCQLSRVCPVEVSLALSSASVTPP